VIIHSDPVSVPGWTGAGYIVFDPVVGDGAYLISGGSIKSVHIESKWLKGLSR